MGNAEGKPIDRRALIAAAALGLIGPALSPGRAGAAPARDGLVKVDGKWYLYRDGAKVVNSQAVVGGAVRFFEPGDGHMAVSKEWADPETGVWHWSDADGTMARSKEVWVPEPGKWVRYDASGAMVRGWYYDRAARKWVNYDTVTGAMHHGEAFVPENNEPGAEGHWYYFDDYTGAVCYGWRYLPAGDKWVYYEQGTGRMLKGEHCLPGSNAASAALGWYYFDPVTGAAAHGPLTLPDGRLVYYDRNTAAMLKGWHDLDGGTWNLDEVDGHAHGFWERGQGASAHLHDRQAIAELACRLAVTCTEDAGARVSVPQSQCWTRIGDGRAQEYIRIMDVTTRDRFRGNYGPYNYAYASCSQAAAAVVRATVDSDVDCWDTAGFRRYLDRSPKWAYVGTVPFNTRMDQIAQPGDVLTTEQDVHTVIWVGNEIVRKMYPGSWANCFEADYDRGDGRSVWPNLADRTTYWRANGDRFRVYRFVGAPGGRDGLPNCWRLLAGR